MILFLPFLNNIYLRINIKLYKNFQLKILNFIIN
jgi:hypothetical protein